MLRRDGKTTGKGKNKQVKITTTKLKYGFLPSSRERKK
jgi:hypothetical protein